MAVKRWFKLKKYPHIGLPLIPKDKSWLVPYVTNPNKIKAHRFTPFIKRSIKQRKYRAKDKVEQDDGSLKYEMNVYGKRERETKRPKKRPIFYASHLDALIYGYYSYVLSVHYEWFIRHKPYNHCAVAYRKIRKDKGQKGNKSNIEFAYDAFSAVKNLDATKVSVIVADVSNFFDELDHKILHRQWKRVLNCVDEKGRLSMPDDHYNVYRSLTKKRFVKLNELHNACYGRIWVERNLPNNPDKTEWKQKKVAKRRNFRRERVVAFCTKKDFFKYHLPLVQSKRRGQKADGTYKSSFSTKGIPQGSPMSALLANIYMLDFDEALHQFTNAFDGFYQRYSDDLVIVCPRDKEKETLEYLNEKIADPNNCNLNIHPDKTQVYRYEWQGRRLIGGIAEETQGYSTAKQLEYLGFEFTGTNVYVKTQGISKYYRSMIRSIKRGKFYAKKAHHREKGLFKNKLFKRFTILGGKRILRFIPDPENKNKYIPDPDKRYNWGNYFSYLLKANAVMKPLNGGKDTITKQTRRFERNFHYALKHPKTKLKQRKPRK
jgi:hypothetical protein|tara:strand:- start:33576 stop:35210 length:1635 start_codon:yes stop_codon:yes gene_type:complete